MSYVCNDCGCTFDEPEIGHDSFAHEFGVGFISYEICPECGSEDIEEFTEEKA